MTNTEFFLLLFDELVLDNNLKGENLEKKDYFLVWLFPYLHSYKFCDVSVFIDIIKLIRQRIYVRFPDFFFFFSPVLFFRFVDAGHEQVVPAAARLDPGERGQPATYRGAQNHQVHGWF